jgi:hypothetical protein
MNQSLDPSAPRIHPEPRKPSQRFASRTPAWTHAVTSGTCSGLTTRWIDTVTGALLVGAVFDGGGPARALAAEHGTRRSTMRTHR